VDGAEISAILDSEVLQTPDSTGVHTSADGDERGIAIKIDEDTTVESIKITTYDDTDQDTADSALIYDATDGEQVKRETGLSISPGNEYTYSGLSLDGGKKYSVAIGKDGSSYDHVAYDEDGDDGPIPIEGEFFDIIGRGNDDRIDEGRQWTAAIAEIEVFYK